MAGDGVKKCISNMLQLRSPNRKEKKPEGSVGAFEWRRKPPLPAGFPMGGLLDSPPAHQVKGVSFSQDLLFTEVAHPGLCPHHREAVRQTLPHKGSVDI